MQKFRAELVLALICVALMVGGCQCKDCKDLRPGILGEYDFGSMYFQANGSGHCTDPHIIGITAGGSPCAITIVGVDGWGIDSRASVLRAEMKTSGNDVGFKIKDGQTINAGNTVGCSSRPVLTVEGEGERIGTRLLLKVTFADSATSYNSGEMQITYEAR